MATTNTIYAVIAHNAIAYLGTDYAKADTVRKGIAHAVTHWREDGEIPSAVFRARNYSAYFPKAK